jgi:hypothetical protein
LLSQFIKFSHLSRFVYVKWHQPIFLKFPKRNITTGKGKGEKEWKLWGREGERRAKGNRTEIREGERDTGIESQTFCL